MIKRKTKNAIIIGTAHLGMDVSVLRVIARVADYYDTEVIYVGPLCTTREIAMWRRRERKLRTWDNASIVRVKTKSQKIRSLIEENNLKIEDLTLIMEDAEHENKMPKTEEKIKKLEEKSKQLTEEDALLWERMGEDRDRLTEEKQQLEEIQWGRIKTLLDIFGDITFVCNDELCIPNVTEEAEFFLGFEPRYTIHDDGSHIYIPRTIEEVLGDKYVDQYFSLGKHLFVTAVPANGDKVSGAPITPRTYRMLQQMGHSHILPHMTPHIKPHPRSGLNQAFNYWTTGALHVSNYPKKPTEAYKSSSRASCVLVSLDEDNEEFHAQRLRVKLFWGDTNHKLIPHILHDGLLFDANDVYELPSSDRGIFGTDAHAPYEHMGAVGAYRALNVLHKPEVIIDGGDTADNEGSSPHAINKPGERENKRIINDINSLVRILDAFGNPEEFPWVKQRILLDSNHGEWLTRYCDRFPELKGLIDWATVSKLIPLWDVFIRKNGEDRSFIFGDLVTRHGDGEGSAEKAYQVYKNYIAGHHHIYYEFIDAVFVGPMCDLGPKYLQNRATSWQNQITSLTKYRGKTCKHPKTVFHNEDKKLSRFAYQGQIYEVKFHKYA